jgi:hypothetical protein
VVPEELAVRVVIKQATAEMNKRICWFCRQSILVGSDLDGGMIGGGHAMRLGDDDAVAAGGFATIKSRVCASHDGVEVQIRADKLSDACGEGYLDASGGKSNGGRGETVAKLFGDVEGSADVGLGQDDRKLFAPETGNEVGLTESVAEQVGNGAKSKVSSIVAVAIVDGFE